MKLDRRFTATLIYGITLLSVTAEGYLLVRALETGMNKTRNLVLLIPLLVIMIALSQRMRMQSMVGFLLLAFWLPAGMDNWGLYLFEILLYAILLLLILGLADSNDERMSSYFINFPWIPFLLYILGALLTWLFSTRIGGELNEIRAMCVLPLALSVVIFLTVRSTADAERFLWIVLTSAAILGLLILVGRNFSGFITLTNYAAGSGRLSMRLSIPQVGSLDMLPQSTSNWFGYLLVFAYSMWIFHHSLLGRAYAVFLCLLFGYVVITAQGRGGAITAALGAAIVSAYATTTRRSLGIRGIWIKFAFVCLAVIGGLWFLASRSTNAFFYEHGTSLFVNPARDANLVGRFQHWSYGLELYQANPILGVGLSGYETPWGLDTSEVLNYFLLNLLGYGLLGFVSILVILLRLLAGYWKGIQSGNRATRMMCIASISGMLGFFLGMQPEEPYSTVIVWAPLLIAFAASTLQESQPAVKSNSVSVMTPNELTEAH